MQNGSMNVQTEGGEMIHIMNTLQETEDDTLTMGSLRCAYWLWFMMSLLELKVSKSVNKTEDAEAPIPKGTR